ncbi:hypothetical protein Tco_1226563 [Tanacetum coccineum]
MSLRTTVLGQMSEIRELHAADRRRQAVISEMLKADQRRSVEMRELRTTDRTRQQQLIQTLTVMQSLQGQVTTLQGQVAALQGQVTALQGQQGPVGGPAQLELPEEAAPQCYHSDAYQILGVLHKCTKKFPKQFNESTVIEDSGYGIYKIRNDGATVKKSKTNLHNGPDKVTATIDGEEVDEIKDYLNCRSLSSCEAAWRIYGFDIHYRIPSVEQLPFHLKDEQHVIFDATESIDYAVDKSSVNETKYESWMQLNQTNTFARSLLYVEIPRYFVWNQKQRVWIWRKQGKSLGRIHHVPPSWGELYYLRAIPNKVRGPMEWDDLKKVDDVLYPTYKDACYARGLLQDDKEYIDGLLEASF